MNRQAWLRAFFAVLAVVVGFALVINKQSSELDLWCLAFFLLLLFPMAFLFLALAEKWRILFHFLLLPALFGFLAFQCFNWLYWPSNIRFSFGTPPGASGSYHTVQFYHKIGDHWIEGPEVEGWPLRVAFPDLDSDGYKDIRVVEENGHKGDAIEFVYVPNAKDGIYWKAHRMDSRLSATYKPAGIFHNYP
jgi:hypothetical protein